MVIETTVAFNKTWLPHAVALEVKLEAGLNLSYILANIIGLMNDKSNEASIGILKSHKLDRIAASLFGLLLSPCQKQYIRN